MFKIFQEPVDKTVWMEEQEEYESAMKPKSRGRRAKNGLTKKIALDFIKEHNGEQISVHQFQKKLDVSQNRVYTVLQELMNDGTVYRGGTRYHYTYHVRKRKQRPSLPPIKKEVVEKVYNFISTHEDILMSQEEIGSAIGIPQSAAGIAIRHLVEDKRIVRSDWTMGGTRYWLADSLMNGVQTQEPEKPEQKPETENSETLYTVIEELFFEFIKERRSVDGLEFLAWLGDKKGA